MKHEWSYDISAPFYDHDMGLNMPFDDLCGYLHLLPAVPAKLLEVGCGTGRLTLALNRHGFSMTAIDRSAPMLEQLRNKTLPGHSIDVKLMDARQIELEGPFEAILFAYSGFQYLLTDSDIDQFCQQAKVLLAASGSLILDIFLHRECSETSGFVPDYERTLPDGRVLQRWKQLSVSNGINCTERKYRVSADGEHQWYQTKSRQRLYTPRSLLEEMEKRGFKLDTGIFNYLPQGDTNPADRRFFSARFKPTTRRLPG